MVTHLHKNFLSDETEYQKSIDFWKTVIYNLLLVENLTFDEYLTSPKPDGSLFMVGNPVFNFKLDNNNRAVRIIQEEVETNEVEFSAWLDTLELENKTIDELVISLELSHESVLLAVELINAWIVNDFPKEKMEKYIDKPFALKETIFKKDSLNQEKVA